jgi:CBS domain-containing protein
MKVKDGMSTQVLSVGPDHTLRQAAQMMVQRNVGAAVVSDFDGEGPGIITERDVLVAIAAGQDPEKELVRDHLTEDATVAVPEESIEHAAETMLRGGFRHIVVVDEHTSEPVGILSMRDVVRRFLLSSTRDS